MYALIQDGQIIQTGALPATYWDGTRWWDLRDADPAELATHGWHEVEDTPRPADTVESTHDRGLTVVDGLPVVTWTPRAWTEQETVDRAENAARLDDLTARVARIEAHLWPPDPDPDESTAVPDWDTLGGVWPNGALLHDGGVWRNVSGVPLTTPPSGFPGAPDQWGHLFQRVGDPEPGDGPAPWVQPSGAHDAYPTGAVVTHNGHTWTSDVDNNTWEPGVYGWTPN